MWSSYHTKECSPQTKEYEECVSDKIMRGSYQTKNFEAYLSD